MTKDELIALEPCPFCGGEAYGPVVQGVTLSSIWCKGCDVEMHSGEDGIPSAAENWNRRAHATTLGD